VKLYEKLQGHRGGLIKLKREILGFRDHTLLGHVRGVICVVLGIVLDPDYEPSYITTRAHFSRSRSLREEGSISHVNLLCDGRILLVALSETDIEFIDA
jgi:hypothetical protein